VPTGEAMERAVREACSAAAKLLDELRAILQHVEKLEQRGWSRSRARDYYLE
jgi:hypothetical protein